MPGAITQSLLPQDETARALTLSGLNQAYLQGGFPAVLSALQPHAQAGVRYLRQNPQEVESGIRGMFSSIAEDYVDPETGSPRGFGPLMDMATTFGPLGILGKGAIKAVGKEGIEDIVKGPVYRSRLAESLRAMPQEKMMAEQAQRHLDKASMVGVGGGATSMMGGAPRGALGMGGAKWFSRIQPDTLPLTGAERGALLNYPTGKTASGKRTSAAISGGALPENLRQDAVEFLDGITLRASARREMKDPGVAPVRSLLERKPGHAKRTFEESKSSAELAAKIEAKQAADKAIAAREQAHIKSITGRDLWNKSFSAEVDKWQNYTGMDFVFFAKDAVNKANMEAVPRALKKEGWSVRHGSVSGGRKSSRYVVSPDGKFEVRLSDHELPDTPQRAYSQEQFGTRWDDEIVLGGSESPKDIIAEIKRLHTEGVD